MQQSKHRMTKSRYLTIYEVEVRGKEVEKENSMVSLYRIYSLWTHFLLFYIVDDH
jgi:hypothetical protein